MALTPANNDAFFREVDEELRRDQVESFARRYGKLIVLGVLVALALVALGMFWQNRREAAAGADGERLMQAITSLATNQPDKAAPTLTDLAGSSRGGVAALARLAQADAAIQRSDTKAAVTILKGVAGDGSLPQPFRDLALIRQTALEFDTIAPAEVVSRLQPLVAATDGPWFGSAGEMVAIADLKLGHKPAAAQLFAAIAKGGTVPELLRSRAGQMATALGAPQGAATAPAK